MIGININLLPEDFRENIRFAKKNKRTLAYVKALILMFILVICSFLICGFALYENNQFFKSSRQETEKTINEYNPIVEEKKKIESRAGNIQSIKSGYNYWTKFNYILSQKTPEGLYLSLLESDNGKLKITGYSKTKQDLGLFRDALEAEDAFSNVNIASIRVIADPVNPNAMVNNFTMTLKVSKEATAKGAVK